MLNNDYPIVEGEYQLTEQWSLKLPDKFNRRTEDGSLVLWKEGLTLWINIWGNDNNLSPKDQIDSIKKDISTSAYDLKDEASGNKYKLTYRLDEPDRFATYGFVAGESGYVQIAIYYDDEQNCQLANTIIDSVDS